MSATERIDACYRYRATCERAIDGDTFIARVDLGFATERGGHGIELPIRVRIRGVDTPERGEPGWGEARTFLSTFVGTPLVIESFKDTRSFERWVCDVWVRANPPWTSEDKRLADLIIGAGLGKAIA